MKFTTYNTDYQYTIVPHIKSRFDVELACQNTLKINYYLCTITKKVSMARIKSKRKGSNQIDLMELLKEQPELAEQLSHYIGKGEKLVLQKETGVVEIHSDNYMVVDTDVLELVRSRISTTDYERLFSLGVFLKTKFNILFNHTRPFTLQALSEKLGINTENTNKFVKRMVEMGIMAYTVCAPSGYVEKIYAINPQLIRRGRFYDKEFITTYFTDFSKQINKKK